MTARRPLDVRPGRARFVSGVAWSTGAFVAARASGVVTIVVLARVLSPSEIGVAAAVIAWLALLELGSDLGLRACVVHDQEAGVTPRVQTAMTLALVTGTVLTVVAWAVAGPVAALLGLGEQAWLLRLASLSLLLTGATAIHDGLLLRDLRMRDRAGPQLLRAGVRAVTTIGLALAGLGAVAIVIGALAGAAAWSAGLWWRVRVLPTLRLDREEARSLLCYGAPASALEGLGALASRIDVLVVGAVLGPSALGLYALAARVPELVVEAVAWNVSTVAFPALAQVRVSGTSLARATLRVVRATALYVLPAGAVVAVLGTPLMTTCFGPAWTAAGPVCSALAVGAAVHAVAFPLGDALKAIARQRQLVLLAAVEVPLLVLGVVLVAPAGVAAVAWLHAGVLATHALALTVLAARLGLVPWRGVLRAAGPGAAVAVAAGGAAALALTLVRTPTAGLLVGGAAALAVAAAAIWLVAPGIVREVRQRLSWRRSAVSTPR